MSNKTYRRQLLDLMAAEDTQVESTEELFDDLCEMVEGGKLVPIIGDTVRNEHIFDIDLDKSLGVGEDSTNSDGPEAPGNAEVPHEPGIKEESTETDGPGLRRCALNITEELAVRWAGRVGYPMIDRYRIARVAQYRTVRIGELRAKKDYLDFQKQCLLELARAAIDEEDKKALERARARVDRLAGQRRRRSFPDLVQELGFPRFPDGVEDPLDILARLPISVFVTTGYYDFVERALRKRKKHPRTGLCLWNMKALDLKKEHRFDPDYEPDPTNPVVYHLFGLEQYPESMVLSEDDYLEFLLRLAEDKPGDSGERFISPVLEARLQDYSLLLLGYRLYDWDFRVLFRVLRVLMERQQRQQRLREGVAIQLDPEDQPEIEHQPEAMTEAKLYLSSYFGAADLRVCWDNTDNFAADLWERWQRWSAGG